MPFWCHALGALLPAHAAQLGGGLVLGGLGAKALGFFAGGDPHDLEGAADHVGGRFFRLGPVGTLAITEFFQDFFWGL
jgi:hypothetical protein